MEREEDSIDLGRLYQIILIKKKIVSAIVGSFTIIALVVSLLLPKEYTSNVLVQVSSGEMGLGGAAAAMAALTGTGGNSKATSYIELMKTRTVLVPIINQVFDDYELEDRPRVEDFVKKNLDITNTKGTSLISIDAKGRTPEEAQYIAENVVSNFLALMTDTNQGGKSELMKFLNTRLNVAQKEADDAALALEEFSKEHKLYKPDAQVADLLTRSAAYDKTISELQVQKQAQRARFDSLNAQISDQDSSALEYSIVDNEVVERIREKIVNKELELVDLRQLYTEEHPSIIRAREDLDELNRSLIREVESVVYADSIAVSAVQHELVTQRYQAATALAVAEASEEVVRANRAEIEVNIDQMSDDAIEYAKLSRDANIKQEVYINLVKQAEQTKIQQTMESMDIQIMDPANLPDEEKPSGPRKKLITAIGFVLGCMVAFGYSLVIYKKSV